MSFRVNDGPLQVALVQNNFAIIHIYLQVQKVFMHQLEIKMEF